MTIKEISELTKKPKVTISNWCEIVRVKNSKVCEKITQARKTKKPADFTLSEAIEILRVGEISEGLISLLIENIEKKRLLTRNYYRPPF